MVRAVYINAAAHIGPVFDRRLDIGQTLICLFWGIRPRFADLVDGNVVRMIPQYVIVGLGAWYFQVDPVKAGVGPGAVRVISADNDAGGIEAADGGFYPVVCLERVNLA